MLDEQLKPTLRDLLKTDSLPDSIGVLKDSIGDVLDKVYYTNLVKYSSREGNYASYNLDLVLYNEIKLFKIPGTEIKFILNPANHLNLIGASSFNCSLEYRLEILRTIKRGQIEKLGSEFKKC